MRSGRSSRSRRRGNPLTRSFGTLQRRIAQSFQEQQRQKRMRQQRKNNQRAKPKPNPQLQTLRRGLEFRWLSRWQQRRKRNNKAVWNPFGWLWPRTTDSLTSREAAAQVLRLSAIVMLVLVALSLVLNAIPLQLSTPGWYLQLMTLLGDNVPVVILAGSFSLLSLVFSGDTDPTRRYRASLLRFSRLGYIAALLLLPIQLGLTVWLFAGNHSSVRTQLTAIRANGDALIAGANQAATTEQFVAYLRSRNITANLQSIAAAPLSQVRSEFIRTVKTNQDRQEQQLNDANRNTLLGFAMSTLKLLVSLVALAAFMRGFQALTRRCSPNRLSSAAPPNPNGEPAPSQDQPSPTT